MYKYPPSRTPSPTPTHPPSLALRLKLLQSELTSLESELADPASPLLVRDREQGQVDPGDLLKGLVDVKARLAKFSAGHEGRARLVQDVLRDSPLADQVAETAPEKDASADGQEARASHKAPEPAKDIAEMDRRVGELEKLVGSAGTSLDEVRPFFMKIKCRALTFVIELGHADAPSTASYQTQHAAHRALTTPTPR